MTECFYRQTESPKKSLKTLKHKVCKFAIFLTGIEGKFVLSLKCLV